MSSPTKPGDAVSRRQFLQSSALVTAALGFGSTAPGETMAQRSHLQPHTPRPLCLWYDQPAKAWMTEALPIGNGPMGAMLFGGTDLERIQFNEISLWGGDRMPRLENKEEEDMGYYQAFGDLFIHLGHDPAEVRHYRRQLDIDCAIHSVEYDYRGVHYAQTAFASHPARAIIVHLTADKPASYSGRV